MFGSAYPSFPAAEWTPTGAPVLLNHDVGFEGMDYPWLPAILSDYIVRHVRSAAEAGVDRQGAMMYNYEWDYPAHKTLAEINLLLLDALMWDPQADTDEVWARWLRRTFGESGADIAGDVLRRVPTILDGILYVNGKGNPFLQYAFPGFVSRVIDDFTQAVEFFQPVGTPIVTHFHNRIGGVLAVPIADVLAEKDRAIAQTAECLKRIEQEKEVLGPAHFRTLYPRFVGLQYYARAARLFIENVWAFSNARLRPYDVSQTEAERAFLATLEALGALAEEMRTAERMRLLEPDVYGEASDTEPSLYATCFLNFLPARIERYVDEAGLAFQVIERTDVLRDKFESNARQMREHQSVDQRLPTAWPGLGAPDE